MSLATPTKTVQKLQTRYRQKLRLNRLSASMHSGTSLSTDVIEKPIDAAVRTAARRYRCISFDKIEARVESSGWKGSCMSCAAHLPPAAPRECGFQRATAGSGRSAFRHRDACPDGVVLVIGPSSSDMLANQYGFRPELDAKMAYARCFGTSRKVEGGVVDADLRDYFTTIPHGPLMRCLIAVSPTDDSSASSRAVDSTGRGAVGRRVIRTQRPGARREGHHRAR